jgi:hypothetical protein
VNRKNGLQCLGKSLALGTVLGKYYSCYSKTKAPSYEGAFFVVSKKELVFFIDFVNRGFNKYKVHNSKDGKEINET